MAEVAGLAIAVACLFSTCVQCFDFYRAGHNLEKNLEIVLVKLDIEKTRLLTWGNTLGILKSPQDGRSKELDDLGAAELVKLKRYLEQIEFLLTDADKLQNEYGLQMGMAAPGSGSLAPQSGSRSKIQSLQMLSSNSMNLFKTSYKRFWVQNMSEKCKPSKISRTKWAIHDQSKFERLVSDLRGLVDGLFNILPVTQAVQDKIIKEDISSILDLSKLRLVQAACTRTYSPWSDIASAIIEASEIGTIDRRNVEEWLNDVEGLENQNTDNGRNLPGKRLEKTPGSSTKGKGNIRGSVYDCSG